MPKEFITTSDLFYLHVQDDGSWSQYFPGRADNEEAGWPKDLDRSMMYVEGIDIRWTPDQDMQIGMGVFEATTHEPYREIVDEDNAIRVHRLTYYATLNRRYSVQALIRLVRRARNAVFGADE